MSNSNNVEYLYAVIEEGQGIISVPAEYGVLPLVQSDQSRAIDMLYVMATKLRLQGKSVDVVKFKRVED